MIGIRYFVISLFIFPIPLDIGDHKPGNQCTYYINVYAPYNILWTDVYVKSGAGGHHGVKRTSVAGG